MYLEEVISLVFIGAYISVIVVAVVVSFHEVYVTKKALRGMTPEVRALFGQGWVLPEHLKLHGIKQLKQAYYPILYNGHLELAYHSSGVWTFDLNEPALEGTFFIHRPRESAILYPPNLGLVGGLPQSLTRLTRTNFIGKVV